MPRQPVERELDSVAALIASVVVGCGHHVDARYSQCFDHLRLGFENETPFRPPPPSENGASRLTKGDIGSESVRPPDPAAARLIAALPRQPADVP
jgi:hypothetical protein